MLRKALNALRPRRYPLLLPLRVWVKGWAREQQSALEPALEEETITENISSAGCYFLISDGPEAGTRLEMEIKMAPEAGAEPASKVMCRGRVVRVDKDQASGKTGVGCAFERYRIMPTSN